MSQREHGHTGRAAEADVENSGEQFVVAIEECVVEGDADLVRVQGFVLVVLLQFLSVLFEHEAKLCIQILR